MWRPWEIDVCQLVADIQEFSEDEQGVQNTRYVARGKDPADNPEVIKEILISNKERIVQSGKLRPPSDVIWQEIKREHAIRKSAKALYTFVSCNRHDVKQCLGLTGIPRVEINNPIDSIGDEETCDFSEGSPTDEAENSGISSSFRLHIPKEKWKIIAPKDVTYHNNDSDPKRLKMDRTYTKFKPGVWTDVLAALIYDIKKLPCSWIFKTHYVARTTNSLNWIKITASCRCGSYLRASCPNPPPQNPNESGVTLDVQIWGDGSGHQYTKIPRRPFSGERRREIGNEMVDKDSRATHLLKDMASEVMDIFDHPPAHIPSTGTLRKAKFEALEARRLDKDPIRSLHLLKYSNPYQFHIQDIGLDPFYCHVLTPDQLRIYNLYCQKTTSRLILDATGKIVDKLSRPCGLESRSIFLYIGVIRIPGDGQGLVPVVQMLSERHNANAIAYWLSEWRRQGAMVPCEVVVDDSAAIISAVCRALADEPSTASYVEKNFRYIMGDNACKPKCLIRLDIAHFTNMVRRWPEIVSLKRRPKEFFIRCVIIAAMAKSIVECRKILLATFVIALTETVGTNEINGRRTKGEECRKLLLSKISGLKDFPEVQDSCVNSAIPRSEEEILEVSCIAVRDWVEDICLEANLCVDEEGDQINAMHHPDLIPKLKKLCYIFPLWSSVLPHQMGSPYERAIGAFVETQFNILKTHLFKKIVRMDDFMTRYLQFLDGTIKIASTFDILREGAEPPPQDAAHDFPQPNVENSICYEPENVLPEDFTSADDSQSQSINKKNIQKERGPLTSRLSCPACANGHAPTGAHKCIRCQKAVHIFEGCSIPVEGQDEGYGERRLCWNCNRKSDAIATSDPRSNINCTTKQTTSTSGDKPSKITTSATATLSLPNSTSIIDSAEDSLPDSGRELRLVEGWKGLSLPPKRRVTGFYLRANPDFPVLLESSKKTKIGIMRNGSCANLKSVKIPGKSPLSVINTCSFDAPCQLFAAAYCDSEKYRSAVDDMDISGTIIEVSKYIALRGINAAAYQKRAALLSMHLEVEELKSGLQRVNCLMVSSSLLSAIGTPPSVVETSLCDSQFCLRAKIERKIVTISPNLEILRKGSLSDLEKALACGGAEDVTQCMEPMNSILGVPENFYLNDPSWSTKGPICAGRRTRNLNPGPHLIVEVAEDLQRPHTNNKDYGVLNTTTTSLQSIPKVIAYCGVTYTLRGAVEFSAPLRDVDAGHYKAHALRPDGSWEMSDDLLDKSQFEKDSLEIPIHLLLYTI